MANSLSLAICAVITIQDRDSGYLGAKGRFHPYLQASYSFWVKSFYRNDRKIAPVRNADLSQTPSKTSENLKIFAFNKHGSPCPSELCQYRVQVRT